MTSARAEGLAEVLWELKRADKLATFTSAAQRAGFSPGTNGRTIKTALKTIRRDWSHLQWWRAVGDDGMLDKGCEQAEVLVESGYEVVAAAGQKDSVMLADFEDHLMEWVEEPVAE